MEVSSDYLHLQQIKLNLFISQDPEIGRFNVVFEIEGKPLYAHQNMLNLVSPTFDSMLSDRWSKKDVPIKITDYSYDDFCQFLIYLYSGQCKLTDSNIYSMVDMAEFYGVQIFKNCCRNYLYRMEITTENVFQLMNLGKIFSITQLQLRANKFITKNGSSIINSDEFLGTSKDVAKRIIIDHKYNVEPEDIFKAVYNWCEIQTTSDDRNIRFNEAIKEEIADFLPHILFRDMDEKFLYKFVVPRGYIFSSLTELGQILSDRSQFFEGKVKITNAYGQTLHGNIIPEKAVLRNIESLKLSTSDASYETFCSWGRTFNIPSTPSSLKKRDGIEWYLFYWREEKIGVEHCSRYEEKDYLLAELIPGDSGFDTAEGCKIEIE